MIYGIEGLYGTGKTSYASFLMVNKYKKTKIWTNVQVDQNLIPNAIIFRDEDILEVLRTINQINDEERKFYTHARKNGTIKNYERQKFTRHVLIFDEASSHLNSREWKKTLIAVYQYLDQQRKNFLDIYILTPKQKTLEIAYRRNIEIWLTIKPVAKLPIFNDFRIVKGVYKDDEGNPILETYIGKDNRGDPVIKQKPRIVELGWYYQPLYWKFYDDLHKNITDTDYELPDYLQGLLDSAIQNIRTNNTKSEEKEAV